MTFPLPMTPGAPATFAQLFEQLSRALNVPVGTNTKDDATSSAAPRVVFFPATGPSAERSPFTATLAEIQHRQLVPFHVKIYGGSLDNVLQLHRDLIGWIDYLIGPEKGSPGFDSVPERAGYSLGPWVEAPNTNEPSSTLWDATFALTLKALAPRRAFVLAPIVEVDWAVTTTAPDGSAEVAAEAGAIR